MLRKVMSDLRARNYAPTGVFLREHSREVRTADVLELIARHDLSRDFARHLHKSVRDTYRKLVMHGKAE